MKEAMSKKEDILALIDEYSDAAKLVQISQAIKELEKKFNEQDDELHLYPVPVTVHIPKRLVTDNAKLLDLPGICKTEVVFRFIRPPIYAYLGCFCPPQIRIEIPGFRPIRNITIFHTLEAYIKPKDRTKRYLSDDKRFYITVQTNKKIVLRIYVVKKRGDSLVQYGRKIKRKRIKRFVQSASILDSSELDRLLKEFPTIEKTMREYIRYFNILTTLEYHTLRYNKNGEDVEIRMYIPISVYRGKRVVFEGAMVVRMDLTMYNNGTFEIYLSRHYEENDGYTYESDAFAKRIDTRQVSQTASYLHLYRITNQYLSEFGFNVDLLSRLREGEREKLRIGETVPMHLGISYIPYVKHSKVTTVKDIFQEGKRIEKAVYLDELDLFAIDCDCTYLQSAKYIRVGRVMFERAYHKLV